MFKTLSIYVALALAAKGVTAAPISTNESSPALPLESISGYLDLTRADDLALLPVSNDTHTGLLVVNTTILAAAMASESTYTKREAEAEPWHWLKLDRGQPMYKREANAEAEAEPWHWLRLDRGQPMYKRDANAEAEAEPWHWLRLDRGQPMYKRDANAEAEAEPWHWLRLDRGQPMY
ncbi:LAME_0C08790g1_1 [Lachancea meyersii CBS 8951]|uniref:Mating factor alpha n=1 Tax=Lachancea meyersii CBS 8951 TaxID=1266667 RepID=A0A1G4J3F2_9SACH|nr:LAME_0C08790g1_1 [Lachancea meyersii CBS 8951]